MLHPKRTDEGSLVAAWREQLQRANKNPFLFQLLLKQWQRILKRLAYFYAQLASLPRRNRRALQRALATSLIGAAMLLAMSSAPIVHAAAITVDPGASGINPGDGCSLVEAIINSNDAASTYAECVAGSGDDIITLPSSATLTYTTPYGTDTALPDIVNKVVIEASSSTIQRDTVNPVPYFRIFNVLYGADLTLNQATISGGIEYYGGGIRSRGTLTVTNSTITDNDAYCGTNFCDTYGGGIASNGTLNISDSTVSGNTVSCHGEPCTAYGGGIAHIDGTAILRDSYVTGNSSSMYDGGIHNGGTMTLYNTTVSGNDAQIYAGGIHNEYETLTLNDSTVSDNTLTPRIGYLYGGAGIVSNPDTSLYVNRSVISGNGTAFLGGGILSGGYVSLNQSQIKENSGYFGGGLGMLGGTVIANESTFSANDAFFGAGIANVYGLLVVNQSTVSGNTAVVAGGVGTGYVFTFGPFPKPPINPGADKGRTRTLLNKPEMSAQIAKKFPKLQQKLSKQTKQRLKFGGHKHKSAKGEKLAPEACPTDCPPPPEVGIFNSTISGNAAYGGGGLVNTYGTVALYNVTVTNNTATDGSGGGNAGGIANAYYGEIILARTIVSGNSSDENNEVFNIDGTITAANYNLFGHSGETNAQAFYGFTPSGSDINATSDGINTPLASILNTTLAFNGGLTQTHALKLNSPAVDKGPNADCTAAPINDVDQRELPRNVNINGGNPNLLCDIGAFELQFATAVNVTNVHAAAKADKNLLKWQTTSEAQIAGFNVYRKNGKQWKQVNAKFKQAKNSGSPQGNKYAFRDKKIKAGKTYHYKIQVQYLDGHEEWTNVVKVTSP